MKQCENCKQTIDEKAKVCPYCGKKQLTIDKIFFISALASFIIILLIVISIFISIGTTASKSAKESEARENIKAEEKILNHNAEFESCFGTNITSGETSKLLAAITTNNVLAGQKNELNTIGICFLSKTVTTDQNAGIYLYNGEQVNSATFDNLLFSSDVDSIKNKISSANSYMINVPNEIKWQGDENGKTGFENEQLVEGNTGGYYSKGYIRLIYIIENNDGFYTNLNNASTSNDSSNFNPNNFSGFPNNSVSNNYVSNTALNSQEAIEQNSKFESFFATNTTASEVKILLSKIRTHNLTVDRNGEPYTVGVCYISKDGTTNQVYGIYSMNNINITSSFFDNLYFCPNVDQIIKNPKPGKNYNVNVPNQIAWQGDINGKTGFETANNSMGQSITGNSGGYYSNGYIRLIYIIEND